MNTTIAIRASIWLAALLTTSGCINVRYPVAAPDRQAVLPSTLIQPEFVANSDAQRHANRVAELADDIATLGDSVDPAEAQRVAQAAIVHAMLLANQYELTKPPVLHNIMVNWGVRPRGLCIHFAEDILRMLVDLELQSLQLHWGVAYPQHSLRLEHSSAVLTAIGQPFEQGLILDGWRHSGDLFWSRVSEDSYQWEPLSNVITGPADGAEHTDHPSSSPIVAPSSGG